MRRRHARSLDCGAMIYVVFVFLAISGIIAVSSNRDLFSPSKLYLFFFTLFHSGALLFDLAPLTVALIFLVLGIGLLMTLSEAQMVQYLPPIPRQSDKPQLPSRDYSAIMWAISIPIIAAQLYMIREFGGLTGYLNSVGTRVVDWAGYGWIRTLINLFTPINLAYFALGLRQPRSWRWWSAYGAHFIILLAMGALSGSRSGLLTVFAMQTILYHYLKAPVRSQLVASLAGILILSSFVLGVVRNGIKFENGQVVTGNYSEQRQTSLSSFNAGVQALTIIAEAPLMPLAHGSTFASVVTNAVPRSLWPEKPDPGGVFFTKNYTGDAWQGFSNLSPTFLGEWLINFGWVGGVVGYALSYSMLMISAVVFYRRMRLKTLKPLTDAVALDVLIYVVTVWALVALMVGETTNILLNLFLSQLLPLWTVRWYVARRSRA